MNVTMKRHAWTRILSLRTQSVFAVALGAALLSTTALAEPPAPTGGSVLSSEPGKATLAKALEISAEVVGIDKATRTLTLKGPKGNEVDVVAGDEVKNFDQIKVGEMVVVRYLESLELELKKVKGDASAVTVSEGAASAKPGAQPAAMGARQVTAVTEVVALDKAASTISLKGPKGKVVTLDVKNPAHFDVVKVGDQVEVTYTEALALSVEPAAKAKP